MNISRIENLKRIFLQKNILKKIFVNGSWLIFDNFYRMFGGLIVFALVARYLGPSQFGLLSYSIAFSTIFTSLSSFGLDGVVVKLLSQNIYDENKVMGNALLLRLIGSFISVILVFVGINIVKPGNTELIIMALIVAISYVVSSLYIIDWWYQSKVNSKYVVISRDIAFTIINIIKIFLVLKSSDIIWFAAAVLLEVLITVLSLLFYYLKHNKWILRWKVDLSEIGLLIKPGWPLILSGLFVYIQSYIDQIMLGSMLNEYELGQYSVAMRVINVFDFIPMILFSTLLPVISKYKEEDENKYMWAMKKIYQLMIIIFLGVTIPVVLLSKPFVLFMYGISYQKAAYLISSLSLRFLFTVIGVARSIYILSDNKYKYAMFTSFIGAIMNITLNLILIPKIGSFGSVVSSILSMMFSMVIIDSFYKDTKKYILLIFSSFVDFKNISIKNINKFLTYDSSKN